jgi:digalactosyldiacylglycerol synthase
MRSSFSEGIILEISWIIPMNEFSGQEIQPMNNDNSSKCSIDIVTTSCLPWLTGTSINPLYRAVYLAFSGIDTTIYFPFIPLKDQRNLYPENQVFQTEDSQREYIKTYLKKSFSEESIKLFEDKIHFNFYMARFNYFSESIYPLENPLNLGNNENYLILEEPEHLLFMFPLSFINNRKKDTIIGILHTNYYFYLRTKIGKHLRMIVMAYAKWITGKVCGQIFSVSKSIQFNKVKETIVFNGVNPGYFIKKNDVKNKKGIYFVGKLIWQKGYKTLCDFFSKRQDLKIDVYGDSLIKKDSEEIRAYARKVGARLVFKGSLKYPWEKLNTYKIFVNTSVSEGACTTTAEAIVMGNWVILPNHPSNEQYMNFNNALCYNDSVHFYECLSHALNNDPTNDPKIQEYDWKYAVEDFKNKMGFI